MASYALIMAALLVLFYGLGAIDPSYGNAVWTVIGITSAAAVVVGIVRNKPRRKSPWVLLALALLTFIAGDTLYNIFTDVLGWADPFPSVVDILYQIFFALVFVALLLLPHANRSRDRTAILDALTVTAGIGLLSWVFLIGPTIESTEYGLLEKTASISLMLWDVLILATGTRLISTVRRTPTVLLLAVGVGGMLVSDVLYGLQQLGGTWSVGGPVDLGWFILYAAWGAAALHPSMVSLTEQRTVWSTEVSRRRVVALTLVSLIAPAVLLVESRVSDSRVIEDADAIAVISALIFLLVLLRFAGVVQTHRQALARERGLRGAGPALVSATSATAVTAAVKKAVARLLPPNTPHRVMLRLRTPQPGETVAGDGTAQDWIALVPTRTLGPGTAEELGDLPFTLVRSLTIADRPAGEPLAAGSTSSASVSVETIAGASVVGTLLVAASQDALIALRSAVEVLGSQAALALERIALSDEINRRNNEAYFRTLVHNTADVILIINDDNQIRYSSPSSVTVFGREALTGVGLLHMIHPDDRDLAAEVLELARSGRDADVNADWKVLDAQDRPVQVEASCRDLRADRTVRGLVLTLRDVTERRRLEQELTHRAFHDTLTGLANRVLFAERVSQAVARSAWNDRVVGVLLIDLDDFKVINDTVGHETGDELLISVAQKLSETLRSDLVARLGGDEFAALIEDARDVKDVEVVAERMVEIFAQPFVLNGTLVSTTASIGVATTMDAADGRDLLRQADLALYVAKGAGKSQWRRYQSAIHTALVERLELRSELDQAIADEALALRYQPIVSLDGGQTVGFEALVRWHHPTRGLVLPGQFIDVAEESGLIVPIGNWVLEKALATAAEWHNGMLPGPPYVSVNVSARQFRRPDFIDRVHRELAAAGVPPSALMLEITESLRLRDDDQIWSDLAALRRAGVRIAIDDFGTGYSALSYLRHLPVDMVKIDKSFIDTISISSQQRALVEGIVRIANTLGLEVVAEGIEREGERQMLSAMGCPLGQGYLFSEPLTDKETTKWLMSGRAHG